MTENLEENTEKIEETQIDSKAEIEETAEDGCHFSAVQYQRHCSRKDLREAKDTGTLQRAGCISHGCAGDREAFQRASRVSDGEPPAGEGVQEGHKSGDHRGNIAHNTG